MKTCKNCFRDFDENGNFDDSPAKELGDMLIFDIGDVDIEDLCPECREEHGMMNLMGPKA